MNRELQVAIDLARRAGEAILAVYEGDFAVDHKGGGAGPVTVADRNADALIRAGLDASFPADALLSEESPDDLVRLRSERVWIVDPLDGTRQFVDRVGEFAVMIGLAVGGRPVLGVVHLPCEEVTYAGAEGDGAFEIDAEGVARALTLEPLPAADLTVAVSRSHYGGRTRRVVEALAPAHLVVSGSVGRKAALVATGRADVYLTLSGHSRHWDACAPDAMLRAAGGAFRDCRGRSLAYNTECTRNAAGLLACRIGLLDNVVAAVDAVIGPEKPP